MKIINANTLLVSFITFIVTIFVSDPLMAAYIEKVKGKKALIFLDGMSVEKGDLVYSSDPSSGKKMAILRITTVKDQKAVGELVKGQFHIDQTVTPKTVHAMSKGPVSSVERRSSGSSNFAIGGMAGVDFDTMSTTNPTGKLTGNGLYLGGVLDYNINDWLGLRGILAYEQFQGKDSGAGYTTNINYLSSMLWGRLNVLQKDTKGWVGVGLGIWFPATKSTNILNSGSISTTAAYAVGAGVDISFSKTIYIPVQIEYGFLPKSNEVSASYYGVHAGLMVKY